MWSQTFVECMLPQYAILGFLYTQGTDVVFSGLANGLSLLVATNHVCVCTVCALNACRHDLSLIPTHVSLGNSKWNYTLPSTVIELKARSVDEFLAAYGANMQIKCRFVAVVLSNTCYVVSECINQIPELCLGLDRKHVPGLEKIVNIFDMCAVKAVVFRGVVISRFGTTIPGR